MSSVTLARAAAALPPNASQEAISDAAEIVARCARESATKVPGRAVTQYIRHHFGDRPPDVRDKLRASALEAIRREKKLSGSIVVSATSLLEAPAYCTLRVAALRYGLEERVLHRMMKWPQHRRAFGWPRSFDGDTFHFLISAIENPDSIAGLGAIEPSHNLPSWCYRVEDVESMDKFPNVP
jgi:hypothetical protein